MILIPWMVAESCFSNLFSSLNVRLRKYQGEQQFLIYAPKWHHYYIYQMRTRNGQVLYFQLYRAGCHYTRWKP